MNQNPFSFYDFLGYLIPGGVFLFLLYFCGVGIGFDLILQIAKFIKNNASALSILNYATLTIASYIAGHFISLASAFFIEKFMNDKLGYPSIYLFEKIGGISNSVSRRDCKNKIKYFIIKIALLPVCFGDCITRMLCYSRSLPSELANVVWPTVKERYKEHFGYEMDETSNEAGLKGDLFRLAYHYVYENSTHHQSKIQNYVALYGFCRNICFVFVIFFWLSFYFFITANQNYHYPIFFTLLSFLLLYVFYVGFVKFYRRYTLEVLMAFSVMQKKVTNI